MSQLQFAMRYETQVTLQTTDEVTELMNAMSAPRPVDAAEAKVRNEADIIARKLGAHVTDIYVLSSKYGRADMGQPAVVYTFSVQLDPQS